MLKRIPSVFWIVLLWWAACALLMALQTADMPAPNGGAIGWGKALKDAFGGWMTWVPLSLGLHWVIRRHPIERGRALRSGLVMTGAVAVIVVLRGAYVYLTDPIFHWYGGQPLPAFGSVLVASLNSNILLAWLVVGMVHALVFYERSREREQKVVELEASLATTRLEALRAQLNPHFLFNALNSVAEMVHRDAELADRMLVSLAALLRDSLSSPQGQQRPLHEELALVRHYLMIEKIRLGERLQVDWQIGADCMYVEVPALILQPLVENAIVHGIARRRSSGTLRLGGRVHDGKLLLEVENSIAPQDSAVPGTGIGLHSTRSRLKLLHGPQAGLSQHVTEAGHYLVQLTIPVMHSQTKDDARRAEAVA